MKYLHLNILPSLCHEAEKNNASINTTIAPGNCSLVELVIIYHKASDGKKQISATGK
jgi:hypothetical protein